MAKNILFLLVALSAVYISSSTRIKGEDRFAFLDAATGSIEAATRALELYNEHLDPSIPWNNLTITVDLLSNNTEDYSKEARAFLPRIREYLLSGLHNYFQATQKVYQWSARATPTLTSYLEAMNATTLLINVLDSETVQLNESISELNDVSAQFDKAHTELLSLRDQFNIDLKEDSTFFRGRLQSAGAASKELLIRQMKNQLELIQNTQNMVNSARENTLIAQEAIKDEMNKIIEWKGTIVSTQHVVSKLSEEHRNIIAMAIKNLLQECEVYRKRHGQSNKQ